MENLVQKHRVLIESKNYPTINPSQLHYMAQLIENQDKEFKLLKESGTVTADVAQIGRAHV